MKTKRLFAFLLVFVMILSMVPAAAFAEDATTPEEVADALHNAGTAEAKAAATAGVELQPDIANDELVAAANEVLAGKQLGDAVQLTDKTNESLGEHADNAEAAQKDAEDALAETEDSLKKVEDADAAAQKALEDAQNAESKKDAEAAAAAAKTEAEKAAEEVVEMEKQVEAANEAAKTAGEEYDAALAEYEAAQAELDKILAEGLADATEAQKKADEAKEKADALLLEKQAAEKEAEEAAEQAAAAKAEAKAKLEAANKELEKAITDNAANVLSKTGTTLLTGAALGATKLAVEAAELVVDYYEGKIEDLQEKIDALNEEIDAANKAIAEAEAELAALDEEDAAYPQAKANLEAAKKARDEAQTVKDNAQAIIDLKNQEENVETLESYQSKVADGTATVEDKKALTEYVLTNISAYDESQGYSEITWINDDTFTVKDKDGNVSRYQMQVVETKDEDGNVTGRTLQYFKQTKVEENVPVSSANDVDVSKINNYSAKTSLLGIEVTLSVKDGKLLANGNEIKWDKNGAYIGKYVKTYLSITEKQEKYVSAKNPIAVDSNSIFDKWEEAEKAEQNLTEKQEALETAQKNYDDAEKEYTAQKEALNAVISENGEIVAKDKAEVEELQAQLKELDRKLNGNLGDQLIRAMIQGDTGAAANATTRILALEAKKLLPSFIGGGLTEEEQEELDALSAGLEDGYEIVKIFEDGSVDFNDAESILKLLLSDNMSAKTRLAICEKVEKIMEEQHEKALKELEEALKKAEEEVAAATEKVASASAEYLRAEAAYTVAAAKAKLAEAAVKAAEELQKQADEAAKAAKEAKEAYEKLKLTADYTEVERAKAAYDAAEAAAKEAQENLDEAKSAALEAMDAYNAAKKIADEYVEAVGHLDPATVAEMLMGDKFVQEISEKTKKNPDELTGKDFVEYVYNYCGYYLKINSPSKDKIQAQLGYFERAKRSNLFLGISDGLNADVFGVCDGYGYYIFFNEETRMVERTMIPANDAAYVTIHAR